MVVPPGSFHTVTLASSTISSLGQPGKVGGVGPEAEVDGDESGDSAF
jgi:hypothetical protein